MMGFKEVKGFIYVSISRISPLIVVYNKKIEKRDYRFRVDFENAEKKIIQNPRLYHLLISSWMTKHLFITKKIRCIFQQTFRP